MELQFEYEFTGKHVQKPRRQGQIESMSSGRKRVYTLTEEAKRNIDTINYIESEVQNFIRKLQPTQHPPLLTH
ncbi:MAG: hypothetical protein U9O89_03585 [Thermoproteota archaeon]|nr:hypothetical protein [Thermoproteota archaeon]